MADEERSKGIKSVLRECLDCVSQKLSPVAYYVCMLLVTIVMALVLCIRKLQTMFFNTAFCKSEKTKIFCPSLVGYGAVHRIFLAHALFHMVMAVVTTEFWVFRNWREKIHNDIWSIKLALLTVLVFGCLWIPSAGDFFDNFLSHLGFLFSFLTILVIMFLLLNIVDYLLDYCMVSDLDNLTQESWTNPRYLFYLTIVSILYIFSALFFIYCFILFANHTTACRPNFIFISYVPSHSLIISILNPLLQLNKKQSSKATSKTLCCILYVCFITWLSLCSNPQPKCNPYTDDTRHPGIDSNAILNIIIGLAISFHLVNNPGKALPELEKFFEVKRHNNDESESKRQCLEEQSDMQDKKRLDSHKDKTNRYSYTTFHILIFLLSLYFMTSTTSWHQTNTVSGHVTYTRSRVAMVILMSATVVCLWVFTCMLVKPVMLVFKNWFENLLFERNKRPASNKMEEVEGLKGNSEDVDCGDITLDNPKDHIREKIDNTFNENEPNEKDRKSVVISENKMDEIIKQETHFIAKDEREKEMIRLQQKVLRLQEKICRLQQKVTTLQGVSL